MKNRTEKNVLRSSCGIFAAALVLLMGAMTTWAANQNLPGTDCSAYNNNQANKLERSHVRLLNPATNTQSLWVICSPNKDTVDLVTGNSVGYAVGFFDTGVTTNIDCVWREFYFATIHKPGGDPDVGNTINAVAFTVFAPVTTPGIGVTNVLLTTPNTSSQNYWTFACKLPPGTGLNMAGVGHQ